MEALTLLPARNRIEKKNHRYLDDLEFWKEMARMGCVHPIRRGKRVPEDQLPRHVSALEGDPYRTLARALRGSGGGWRKNSTPFAELMWADFLRKSGVVVEPRGGARRSTDRGGDRGEGRPLVRVKEAKSAEGYRPVPKALLALCWSKAARGVPGWIPRKKRKRAASDGKKKKR